LFVLLLGIRPRTCPAAGAWSSQQSAAATIRPGRRQAGGGDEHGGWLLPRRVASVGMMGVVTTSEGALPLQEAS